MLQAESNLAGGVRLMRGVFGLLPPILLVALFNMASLWSSVLASVALLLSIQAPPLDGLVGVLRTVCDVPCLHEQWTGAL